MFSGKEHWLGLQNIYKLTNRQNVRMQLKIILERFSGETESVLYDDFFLEDQVIYVLRFLHIHFFIRILVTHNDKKSYPESSWLDWNCDFQALYKLKIGSFHGSINDALGYHKDMPFSTKDQNNSGKSRNCATEYKGAWWYKTCHSAHLNGRNFGFAKTGDHSSIGWYRFGNSAESLKSVKMAIRPQWSDYFAEKIHYWFFNSGDWSQIFP